MSQYQGFATQRGFGANLIKEPFDKQEKIRQQGLQALQYMREDLEYSNRQADRVISQFESNNALEAKQRAENFKDRQFYADTLAQAKWKQFETEVKNAQRRAQQPSELQQILALTQTGAALYKDIDTRRKVSIDKYADEIYRDYGLGHKAVTALQNEHKTGNLDKILNDASKLEALTTQLQIDGNTPVDVLQKLARSNGYLPIAVQKLAAVRFGQTLQMRVAQRLNDEMDLPGLPPGVTYNTAKDPGLREMILNRIIGQTLEDENGQKLFSNNVMQLSGLIGPDGTIAKTKASFHNQSASRDAEEYYADRHKQTVLTIQSFIAPGIHGSDVVGGAGFQQAIYHFAGGEDASREALAASRERVVDAVIDGLKNDEFTWSQVEGWGDLPITQRGSNKEVKWKDLFKREWDAIQDAGKAAANDAAEDHELRLEGLKEEARDAEIDVDELIANGNPTVETLAKLHGEFAAKGAPFEKVAQKVATALTRGRTTANDKVGTAVLLERAAKGEYITIEDIKKWNFSVGVASEVQARVNKHNQTVPTEANRKRLTDWIDGHLEEIIPKSNSWDKNKTHADALANAVEVASTYYMNARDAGRSHEQAYAEARDLITQAIQKPDGDWAPVDMGNGVRGFKKFIANPNTKHRKSRRQVIANELAGNPNLIHENVYIDDSGVEEFAGKIANGYNIPLPPAAMLIQSLTNGNISALDAMQAQIERVRNAQIAKKGSTTVQSLPDSYIKLYKKEEERIPRGLSRYLTDINPVGPNIAYTGAGYQPPNQEHYYKRIRPLVSVGNPNAIAGDDLVLKDSTKALGANITNATIRQIFAMMANGHFSAAGEGQWDASRLQAAVEAAGLPLETKFNVSTQQKLLDVTIKNFGVAGFPHKVLDEDAVSLIEEIKVNVNEEKLPSNYWRSRAACNDKACAYMKQEGITYGQ